MLLIWSKFLHACNSNLPVSFPNIRTLLHLQKDLLPIFKLWLWPAFFHETVTAFSAFTSRPISLLVTNKTFYFALQKVFPPNRLTTSTHSLKFYHHTKFYYSQISHGSVMYTSSAHFTQTSPLYVIPFGWQIKSNTRQTQWVLVQFCIFHSV
jgi:hypothetical protein